MRGAVGRLGEAGVVDDPPDGVLADRRRHFATVAALAPSRSAMPTVGVSSPARRMIRARRALACGVEGAAAIRDNSAASSAVSMMRSRGQPAFAMPPSHHSVRHTVVAL